MLRLQSEKVNGGDVGFDLEQLNGRVDKLKDKNDVYSFEFAMFELIISMPGVDMETHRHEINLTTLSLNQSQD